MRRNAPLNWSWRKRGITVFAVPSASTKEIWSVPRKTVDEWRLVRERGPHPDGVLAIRLARRKEASALAEYMRVLRVLAIRASRAKRSLKTTAGTRQAPLRWCRICLPRDTFPSLSAKLANWPRYQRNSNVRYGRQRFAPIPSAGSRKRPGVATTRTSRSPLPR
jgi:hypothetical protein